MYNPYENNNRPAEDVKENPEVPAQETVNGEYRMRGNEIPENKTPVDQKPYSGYNNNQGYRPQGQNYQYNYYHNGYQQPQTNSYTWNQQPRPAYQYQQPAYQQSVAPKKKSKAGKVFLKVVAVFLCCLISSAAAVGGFAYLIKDGYITVTDPGTEKTAFTITKVVDNTETVSTESTTAGKLTTQQIAETLIPSVVCIQNYQINEQFNFFGYQAPADDSEVSPAGEGSGVIMSEDGYIITNAHVIAGATSLKVITSDGETYEATLVGSDEVTDLAVIKVEATGLPAAEFGSADDLRVGDQVVAIGNPGGSVFSSSVTVGYVSALDREIMGGEDGYSMFCIQTDAAINPGNSGGALVNEYGMVVGINSSKIVANGYEGLGFAIPSETFQPVVSDLINYGYVKDRAVLGISGSYLDEMTASFYGMVPGMYVAEVVSEAAKNSGLKQYDIITSIDGVQVTSPTTITSVVSKKSPGDTVTVTVARLLESKTEVELTVTLSQVEPE